MSSRPAFIKKQYEFAAYIRDPKRSPAPADVEERRMAIYRELFFNNVEDFMSGSYPVLREVLGEDRWLKLMRKYFAHHRAKNPLFPSMPSEFIDYLQITHQPGNDDPPFLLELAHYEWMELALVLSDDTPDLAGMDPNGDLLTTRPVVTPLAAPLSYWFPVHRISTDNQPEEPGETPSYLVVYRNRKDEVHFLEINAVTYRLLQLLDDDPVPTGQEALVQIAEELKHPQVDVVIDGGLKAMEELKRRGILLGTRPA